MIAVPILAVIAIVLIILIVGGVLIACAVVAVTHLGRIADASETTKLIASNHRDLADTHLRFVQTLADQERNARDIRDE